MLLYDRDAGFGATGFVAAGFGAAHDNPHPLESELKLVNSNLLQNYSI